MVAYSSTRYIYERLTSFMLTWTSEVTLKKFIVTGTTYVCLMLKVFLGSVRHHYLYGSRTSCGDRKILPLRLRLYTTIFVVLTPTDLHDGSSFRVDLGRCHADLFASITSCTCFNGTSGLHTACTANTGEKARRNVATSIPEPL